MRDPEALQRRLARDVLRHLVARTLRARSRLLNCHFLGAVPSASPGWFRTCAPVAVPDLGRPIALR
jgi:hypothetical protein